MENLLDLDLAYCEACDSYVTAVLVGQDYLCKSEVDVFGADLASVVG